MYFDRYDICSAWCLALLHCHGGKASREYARLCKLLGYFRPGHFLSVDTLTENGLEIYEQACQRMLGVYWKTEDMCSHLED